jgi:hypothetical protein
MRERNMCEAGPAQDHCESHQRLQAAGLSPEDNTPSDDVGSRLTSQQTRAHWEINFMKWNQYLQFWKQVFTG